MNPRELVRDFYERMPYPAPVASLDKSLELYGHPDSRRALFHLIWPADKPGSKQDILIAGCGTSQAARYALREPDAHVTAIDISERSLRHTRELREKYKLNNLELHQLQIESIRELGRTFDLIVCTGVLHHLPDPDIGLQALRDVLKPKGAMQLMVYATYGRAGIYMMQAYCRLLGIAATDGDLRELDGALAALPREHPIANVLNRTKDFRHPDAMADALLHPQDRAYTVPEIYAWLERCGISFGRWYEQAPYLPQCGAIAKTPHAARLSALPEPAQHAAVELFRGTMSQHNFVAYRSDRAGPSQPVHFEGEQWRNYIPIRLPWAITVYERVPAGSAAVLVNTVHQHRDLFLPIDSTEEHLLEQIDGRRTLGEIVQGSATQEAAARVLSFFRQLSRYDQIVFDASCAP